MSAGPIMRVREVMNTSFGTTDANATVAQALEVMRERSSAVLVVKKRGPDDEYGLLLCSDIARDVLARNRAAHRVNVYEVMRKPVICVRADMDIRMCSKLFVDFGLLRAPVVDGDDLVGTISPNRLVLLGLYGLSHAARQEAER